jgi:two-component system, OmpR family, sensor histidine kinase BaeS
VRGLVALAAVVTGLALVVSEATMRPSGAERLTLYVVFAASALLAGTVGLWLTRVHRRLPSLRWTMLVVAVAAVAVAAFVVGASAAAMFLAPPDVRLVLAALTLGTGLGVLVAISVTGPLTADLRKLADAAHRVAEGDLTVRTRIHRRDEVGALAHSLDRMVDQLAQLEQTRERGEAARRRLLASVGHDLRTPLASLRAAVEALQDGVATEPDRYLRSMAGDVNRLSSMVDDLFVLARLEAGDLRLDRMAVDLSELVDGAVEAVAPVAARNDVQVVFDSGGATPAWGDPRALDRVLRNLLDNAITHAPPGTTVHVDVDMDGGSGLVRVRDEGPGFPPGFPEQAFDRFSRADAARERRGGGAGLGLAIARELVDAHGGSIWIEQGPGAVVAFRVPTVDLTGNDHHP